MASFTNIKGFAELEKFLNELPGKMAENVVRASLREGGKVIANEARQNCPVGDTGALRKSIDVGSGEIDRSAAKIRVPVRAGGKHKKTGADAYYAPWVEYGVAAHGVKKGAKRRRGKYQDGKLHPGMNPKPFMRPALDSKAHEAVAAVGRGIKKRLTKKGIDTSDVDLGD